ncbi:MAG: hypothetical protein CW346_00315 [Bacillaceae bacterium]|nr:hypothetical protein [Bacillaceae bacterium]
MSLYEEETGKGYRMEGDVHRPWQAAGARFRDWPPFPGLPEGLSRPQEAELPKKIPHRPMRKKASGAGILKFPLPVEG